MHVLFFCHRHKKCLWAVFWKVFNGANKFKFVCIYIKVGTRHLFSYLCSMPWKNLRNRMCPQFLTLWPCSSILSTYLHNGAKWFMRQRFYSPAILTLELDYDFKNEIYKNVKGQMEKKPKTLRVQKDFDPHYYLQP